MGTLHIETFHKEKNWYFLVRKQKNYKTIDHIGVKTIKMKLQHYLRKIVKQSNSIYVIKKFK